MKRMKEFEIAKYYTEQLITITNKVRWLGEEFFDEKIIYKILVTFS